jgi:hypothetical protein
MAKLKKVKHWTESKNRMGYTSFIKDYEEMSEDYELALDDDDIDQLDHFMIATVHELGISKEIEIKKLKKKNRSLKEEIKALKAIIKSM